MRGEDVMNVIEVNKINDKLYILNENINPKSYYTMALVIGSEKAAIIDTGYGTTGDLDKIIRNITDRPVICLLTHCDPDHAGSAALFDEIYMSSLDEELMNGSLNLHARMMVVKNSCDGNEELIKYAKDHIVKNRSFQYKNIEDGDIFDLGDCKLEVVSLPGHSKGSMCFLNRKENYAITGDSIANINSPVLFFQKCLPLSVYKENLEGFIEKVGKDVVIYTGHDIKPLKKQIIPEILTLCDEVMASDTAKDTPYIAPFMKIYSDSSNWLTKTLKQLIMHFVSKKQLGNSIPLEHKKDGYTASIKYNANKI
jgi:glyoxylase-like metal-dependent hydrolase (beta-lactamase superfamily II)